MKKNIENHQINKAISFVLKMKTFFPKSKKVYYFIFILKLIPLLVITHDWNIKQKYSICFWIRKFTLAEIISTIKTIEFYYVIGIILFIIFLLLFIFYFILLSEFDAEGKICRTYETHFSIFSYLIYYIFFLLTQYYYSIFMEIILNPISKNQNKTIYIIIICITSFPILYSIIITIILTTILIDEPLFIKNESPFINKMNEIDYRICIFSCLQAAIQSEFYLSFEKKVILKIIIRVFYIIKYIHSIFDCDSYYSSFYEEKVLYFFFSICFVSCIIEFAALYDYNNDLKILQKDSATIIIKLIVEICFSLILTEFHFYLDNKTMKKEILKFTHMNPKSFNNKMLKFLNELHYQHQPNLLKSIFLSLNNEIESRTHNPKCKRYKIESENCYYCHIFNSKLFLSQMNSFLNNISNNYKFKHNCIKSNFPLLYLFLENEIEQYQNMNFDPKNILTYFLFIITFLFIYEKNYYKCVFLLEKLKDRGKIKKNNLVLLQIENLKEEFLKMYNDDINHLNGNLQLISVPEEKKEHYKIIKEYNNFYKSIDRILFINDGYKSFLYKYIDTLRIFNEDLITFKKFSLQIKNFYNYYFRIKYENELILSQYKCKVSYPYYKYIVFYEYFFGILPKKKEIIFHNFFSYQLTSLLKDPDEYFSLILTVDFTKSGINYKINYATTTLVHKLKYNNNEFKNLDAKNIFPKSFSKSYHYQLRKTLEQGNDFIKLNNFCLLDKENYIILFDVEGKTIFGQNKIEFYLKLTEAKEQLLINKNSMNSKNNSKKKSKKKRKANNNYYGASFLFSKRNGKILNLSRGFEDFFFINSEILNKYQINVIDLFKIEKLQTKGSFTINLNSVYDSINSIYMREVGQLGEDPFSKIILPLNNLIDSLESSHTNFKLEVIYEQKELIKDVNKIKYYFLFVTSIFEEENNELILNRNIRILPQSTVTSQPENSDTTLNSFIKNSQQENNTILGNINSFPFIEKINSILNLSNIILQQFFNIKIPKKKEIDNDNDDNDDINNKNKESNDSKNENNEKNNENERLNRRKVLLKEREKRNNFIFKYYPSFVSIIFGIALFFLFLLKLKKIYKIKKYLQESNNCFMLTQTIYQIILKVLSIQIRMNELREETINDYNNSVVYHQTKLKERLSDYLYFNGKFLKFFLPFVPKLGKENLSFLNNLNFTICELNGAKKTYELDNIFTDLNIDLIQLLNISKMQILFNNSEYYYNEEFINKSGLSEKRYYMSAYEVILILETFYQNLNFEISEIIITFSKIITDEVKLQYKYALITMTLCVLFSLFYIIQFFLFLNSTNLLFSKYFLSHLQLRFFNIFLIRKTAEILDFFENSTRMDFNRKLFEYIEIIDNNEENNIIKIILTERIYDFNMIKIKPYVVRTINYKGDPVSKLIGDDLIEKESIKSSLELSSFTKNVKKVIDSNKQKIDNLSKFRRRASLSKIQFSNKLMIPTNALSPSKGNPILKSPRHLPRNLIVPQNFARISSINSKINQSMVQTLNQTEQSFSSNNMSLTKSTIPLNDSSNRTNSTNLKLLNKDIKNIRKNTVKKEEEETTLKFDQNGHKLMKIGLVNSTFLIQLLTIIIIFIGLSVIQIILSVRDKNMYISILGTESSMYQYYNYITQFVLTYDLSVLSNKELTGNFNWSDLSYICKEAKLKFTNKEKNLFNILKECYPSILDEVTNVGAGNINSNLKSVRQLRYDFLSDNFCENYATFLSKYSDELPKLTYLDDQSYDTLYKSCSNIGNNINSKGLSNAIDAIYNLIVTYYSEFVSDNNRTELSNYNRISDYDLFICEIEITKIIRKAALCYYVSFKRDFKRVKKVVVKNEIFAFVALYILIFSICFLFIIYVNKLSKENDQIDFFYNIIINTILYKKQ